jgi:hypothetical protein
MSNEVETADYPLPIEEMLDDSFSFLPLLPFTFATNQDLVFSFFFFFSPFVLRGKL